MKIIISGNYGAGNIGDEMILDGMLEMLKNVAPKAEITVLSGRPQETAERHKVSSEYKFPSGLKSLLHAIIKRPKTKQIVKDSDYFILGGGGLFNDLTLKANIIWGIQAMRAYLYKKPVIMYGQSVGPLKGKIRKWIVKKLFKKAKLIVVRDEQSKLRLKKLGITKTIHVLPDMAFRLEDENPEKDRNKKLYIVLQEDHKTPARFRRAIETFLDRLKREKKLEIEHISFQEGDSGKLATSPIEDFSKAYMVLGMRLHSIITAIKTKTPFIAISYAPKVEDFLKDAKFNDCMVRKETISPEELTFLFKKARREEKTLVSRMDKYNKEAKKRHKDFEDTILRKLLSGDH